LWLNPFEQDGISGAPGAVMLARLALAAVLCLSTTADAALTRIATFGANPGALAMYEYTPAGLATGRPLVVVLHGCTQTAADMERAGWNVLAEQHGFAVVYPEQQTANNSVRCFNWAGEYGDPTNLVRGQGENASVMSMIDHAIATHGSDPSRVYIVGFSAGGAFAAVMLATWPERFAGGAIMAGVPYRCATSVNGAFSCQSPGVSKTAAQWGDLVRAASSFSGTRPPIQIWHGAADSIVVPANARELIEQFTNAAGTDDVADETTTIDGATRTVYKAGARTVVESYAVPAMGHATAVGGTGCPSTAGSYFENRGICSTLRAAQAFGLMGGTGPTPSGPDNAAPTLSIVSPADGSSVTGTVTVVVAAADNVATTAVTLSIDGSELPADVEAPFQFDWDATAAGTGEHELVATASDAAGNTTSVSATVTVPGAGSADGDGEPDGPSNALPGCSLDASGGGAGLASLAIVLALALARRPKGTDLN
jgi:poly(hydroxyalkanoate) depolymerase family esterase